MDRVEVAARADPKLEAPTAQQIEGGRRLGEHRRGPERQVGDVGEDAHGLRLSEDRREQ